MGLLAKTPSAGQVTNDRAGKPAGLRVLLLGGRQAGVARSAVCKKPGQVWTSVISECARCCLDLPLNVLKPAVAFGFGTNALTPCPTSYYVGIANCSIQSSPVRHLVTLRSTMVQSFLMMQI